MYCSGCGQLIAPGQAICPQCGRPAAAPVPPIPGLALQLETYASKVKALSIVWYIWAGLSLAFGLASLAFANALFAGRLPFWMHGPLGPGGPPMFLRPMLLHFFWLVVVLRTALAGVAAWGLWERSQWGRVVAIVAAILGLLKFPFGTALGIWTLVVLLGYRNASLYEQISSSSV